MKKENKEIDNLLHQLCSLTELDIVRIENDIWGNARYAIRGLGKNPSLLLISGLYPNVVDFPEWDGKDHC